MNCLWSMEAYFKESFLWNGRMLCFNGYSLYKFCMFTCLCMVFVLFSIRGVRCVFVCKCVRRLERKSYSLDIIFYCIHVDYWHFCCLLHRINWIDSIFYTQFLLLSLDFFTWQTSPSTDSHFMFTSDISSDQLLFYNECK